MKKDATVTEQLDVQLTLEANAKDSLIHGVRHFLDSHEEDNVSELKHTVLHTFHATELFLKTRLSKAHPTLIFSKPEDAHKDDAMTVTFETLIGRLRAAHVPISNSEYAELDFLRKVRNRIEHHKVVFRSLEVDDYVSKVIKFLKRFLSVELQIELKDVLHPDDCETLEDLVFTYEERVAHAQRRANEHRPHGKDGIGWKLLHCPECGQKTVPPGSKDGDEVQCYFCDSEFFVIRCGRCDDPILSSSLPNEEEWQKLCMWCHERLLETAD